MELFSEINYDTTMILNDESKNKVSDLYEKRANLNSKQK